MEKIHFISGLPRSGSTVLSTILKQNPKFHASISDPLLSILKSIITTATGQAGFKKEVTPERTKAMLEAVVDAYYFDQSDKIVFNTNRAWTANLHLLKDLYPDSKCIVCVRDIGWILDSFEQLYRKNPYTATNMYGKDETTVYSRANGMMKAERTVGFAYAGLKQAMTSGEQNSMCIIEYDKLVKDPKGIMQGLYKYLGEPYFEHDFNNVEGSYDEYDEDFGVKGLHTTRKEVKFVERETILPPDIWDSVKNMNFWKKKEEAEHAKTPTNSTPGVLNPSTIPKK